MHHSKRIAILFTMILLIFISCSKSPTKRVNNSTIKITTNSKQYKLGDSINIEASSTKNGFINIFILNPKSQIMKIGTPIKKHFKTYLKTSIVGEYKLVVIYTPQRVNIKKEDFSINSLKEDDVYDIYTFQINN